MVSNPAPGPGDQTGDPAAGRVPALLGDRPGRCLGAEPLVSGAYRLAFHAHGDQAVTVTEPDELAARLPRFQLTVPLAPTAGAVLGVGEAET